MSSLTLPCGSQLHCADFRDVEIREFDHLIADPPYEAVLHKALASGGVARTDGYVETDKALDFDDIVSIRGDLAALSARASGGAVHFCTPEGIAAWRDALEAAGLRYKRACSWCKPDARPQMNGQGPSMAVENFVWAWAGKGVSRWNGGGGKNWFVYPTNPPSRDGRHTTEKPVELMAEIIRLFTGPGDTILDPCMGSGTTGIAALRMGRRFIGIEVQPHWYEVAVERISAVVEPDLLSALPRYEQPEMAVMG